MARFRKGLMAERGERCSSGGCSLIFVQARPAFVAVIEVDQRLLSAARHRQRGINRPGSVQYRQLRSVQVTPRDTLRAAANR